MSTLLSTLVPPKTLTYLASQGWYPEQKGNQSWFGCCPFHHEKHPSFHVYEDGHAYCYGQCNQSWSLVGLVCAYQGWDVEEKRSQARAYEILRGMALAPEPSPSLRARKETHVPATDEQMETMTLLVRHWHECLFSRSQEACSVRRYLTQIRGVAPQTLHQWQIGYAPLLWQKWERDAFFSRCQALFGECWRDRLISIGVLTRDGKKLRIRDRIIFACTLPGESLVRFYQGRIPRSAEEDEQRCHYRRAKYLNPWLAKVPFAFPLSQSRIPGTILTESPLGPAVLHQYDIATVATLGNGASLFPFQEPVWLAQDADDAGDRQAAQHQRYLQVESYRLRPNTQDKGLDEWVHHQGLGPLLDVVYGQEGSL